MVSHSSSSSEDSDEELGLTGHQLGASAAWLDFLALYLISKSNNAKSDNQQIWAVPKWDVHT